MARRKAQSYGSASVAGYGGRLSARHTRSYSVRYRASRYLSADRGRPEHERMLISRRFFAQHAGPRFRLGLRSKRKAKEVASFRSQSRRAQIGQRPAFLRPPKRASRRRVAQQQVVSQLLAGPHSGPGRSPGAARVARLRTSPAGAAPHPASRRLMSAPFGGRGGVECKDGAEAGDYFYTSPSWGGRPA
jgi:hypothetical protein